MLANGGVAQSTETIEKATWTLAGVMGLLSLLAAFNLEAEITKSLQT